MGSYRTSPAGPVRVPSGNHFWADANARRQFCAWRLYNVQAHVTLIALLVCAEGVTTCQVTPGNSSTAKIALKLLGKVSGQWQAVGTAPDVLEQVAAQRTVRRVGECVGSVEEGRYGRAMG